jgi:hypothetical protein
MISTKQILDVTLDNIYARISDYDIFRHYIPSFTEINKPFLSELRVDKSPNSVRIFRKGDNLFYKDFATKENYSAISYVMKKYNISFPQALNLINYDFELGLGISTRKPINKPPIYDKNIIKNTKMIKQIQIVSDKWSSKYLNYWLDYGISLETLLYFNVKPLKGFYINFDYIEPKLITYAYCFGNYRYKILTPEAENHKWVSNVSSNDIQGYHQLPKTGDVLFITSSMKDVMSLYEIGYSAIAPQSENGNLDEDLIEHLANRFYRIVVFYDNDKTGLQEAKTLCDKFSKYKLESMITPEGWKDPSDYVKDHSLLSLKLLIDSTLF